MGRGHPKGSRSQVASSSVPRGGSCKTTGTSRLREMIMPDKNEPSYAERVQRLAEMVEREPIHQIEKRSDIDAIDRDLLSLMRGLFKPDSQPEDAKSQNQA